MAAGHTCPGCGEAVSAKSVICISCGLNLKSGKKIDTSVCRAVKEGGKRHRVNSGVTDEVAGQLNRSWQFAKIAYGIIWDFKQLIVFPIMSGAAAILVTLSFVLPLWGTGTLDQFEQFLDEETAYEPVNMLVYMIAFTFYFCCYLVIVFFNTTLPSCAMKMCAGEAPIIGYGLGISVKRLPQIIG